MDGSKKFKPIQGSEDVADDRDPPIFRLNDDCVRYIFSFLHMKQRIQIQRVCKRWQTISKLPWNDVKKLDTSDDYSWIEIPDPKKIKYDLPILKQILQLCGSSVTHMILPGFRMTASIDLIILLKKACPSLRSLDFNGTVITRKTAKFMAENFTDLTEIKINHCWPNCEDSLSQFFANNRRLKSIIICGCDRITGACFSGLPESLNTIVIYSGDNIQPEYFCNALQKLINLRSLEISSSVKLLHKLDPLMEALPDKLNIEELKLICHSSSRSDKLISIKNIIRLTNLRKLVLNGNMVLHEETLINVGTYCKNLKIVHLYNSNRVKNLNWQSFTAALDLEELKIVDLSQLPDKAFAYMDMPSLKILKCYKCHRLNSKTFKKLVQRLDNLERLDVFYCGDGTYGDHYPLIKDVLLALKNRKNGKTLEMHVLDHEDILEVPQKSSLILIKDKNFCEWK